MIFLASVSLHSKRQKYRAEVIHHYEKGRNKRF